MSTGQIEWTLGGKHSSFRLGAGAGFEWQHDVVSYPNSPYLTMFDDHCCQITGGGTYVSPTAASRGLVLKLDVGRQTASLAGQYLHGSGFNVDYMGSTEPLANHNEFVGWGSQPYFSEYSASGQLLLDGVLPGPDITYRALVEPWVGLPAYPPAAAVRHTAGRTTVYASWNGATAVASWRVLGSASGGSMSGVATRRREGFETAIPVPAGHTTYEVQALDARGKVLGTSRAVS